MIDITKQYKTRGGMEAIIHSVNGPRKEYPVVASINDGGCWGLAYYTSEGCLYPNGTSGRDLIEVKPERTVWVNIYPSDGRLVFMAYGYSSRECADQWASKERTECVEFTYREGDGL